MGCEGRGVAVLGGAVLQLRRAPPAPPNQAKSREMEWNVMKVRQKL